MTRPSAPRYRLALEQDLRQDRELVRRAVLSIPPTCSAVGRDSHVVGSQASTLRNPGEHSRPDLFVIVEGKHEVRPSLPRKRSVRARLTFERPPDPVEAGQDAAGFRRALGAHAARNDTLRNSAGVSPCSRRSARSRSAVQSQSPRVFFPRSVRGELAECLPPMTTYQCRRIPSFWE